MAGEAGKNSKYGRNKPFCLIYKRNQQRERNKAKRLLKHFAKYGYGCASAVHCYNNLPMLVKPRDMLTVTLQKTK